MKKRIFGLMLAGSISLTTMLGLAGCADLENTTSAEHPKRKELVTEMALDAEKSFINVVSFDLEKIEDKYYINFLAHNSEGQSYDKHKGFTYREHEDYIVTYELTEAEYTDIESFYSRSKGRILYLSLDDISKLQLIVDTYKPLKVESLIDTQSNNHTF